MTVAFDGPVAVTGASGYVASHVVRELLARGATVHATVRNPTDKAKVAHLHKAAEGAPGTLKLFAADLLAEGSFAEALAGCVAVIHTASPFLITTIKDPQKDLVDPALLGTRNVLNTASKTPSVRRVVLTSSVVAMYDGPSDAAAKGRPLNDSDWNETSSLTNNPYGYSKTVAEREAWALAKAQSQWHLVVVNPGFVMGPSLTPRNDSASIDFLLGLINGKYSSGMWEFYTAWVDVRDVAIAHVEAALRADAEGRHPLVSANTGIWAAIELLRTDFASKLRLPGRRVPKWAAYLAAPVMGLSWGYVTKTVDIAFSFDGSRATQRLGLNYRPLRDTLRDHVEQLIRDGLFVP